MVAHGVSRGLAFGVWNEPQRGDRALDPRDLAPLRGWVRFASQPRAYALGYRLPVLRTSRPAAPGPAVNTAALAPNPHPRSPGPEGRKMVAHGVSRGWAFGVWNEPQRGDRALDPRDLAPLRGWICFASGPTADAVGYRLPVLRTSGAAKPKIHPQDFFPVPPGCAILGLPPSAKAGGPNPDTSAPTWHGTDLYPAPESHRFQHQGTSTVDATGSSCPAIPLHGRHCSTVGRPTHSDQWSRGSCASARVASSHRLALRFRGQVEGELRAMGSRDIPGTQDLWLAGWVFGFLGEPVAERGSSPLHREAGGAPLEGHVRGGVGHVFEAARNHVRRTIPVRLKVARQPRNLAPLRGWVRFASQPRANALGYRLSVLRTSRPAAPGPVVNTAALAPNPHPRSPGPEGRKMVAHGVSRGLALRVWNEPQRGDRTLDPRNLAPLRGWICFASQPRAYALGYRLPVLRTSRPAAPGPDGRKMIAHGVSRGWTLVLGMSPSGATEPSIPGKSPPPLP